MALLEDGTVIPSFLTTQSMGVGEDMEMYSNVALRVGEVKEILYPDDKKNVNQSHIEYVVEVQHLSPNGTGAATRYHGCTLANLFGGAADQLRYTLRPDEKDQPTKDGIGVGSKVLILCLDGRKTRAIIVGGVRNFLGSDTKKEVYESKDKKEDGHNLFFEFNGIQSKINKDGELTVMYRGATKVDGKLSDNADEKASGSTVTFTKEGGIKLFTAEEKQFIHLDHKNKKLDILADEEWHVKVNKKLSFEAGDAINVQGDKDCTIEITDKVYIKSAGVHVGDATDAWLLASTYRQSEQSMHQTFTQAFGQLATLLGTIGGSLSGASASHAIPIVGPIIGAPAVAAAGSAAISAATAFGQLASAVGMFEGKSVQYLSKKNKND